VASIDKRPNGTWRARWREAPGQPQKTRSFARKVDAQRFLDGIVGDLARGTYVDPGLGRETFGDYALAWQARQVHRDSTAATLESHLRLHILPTLGPMPLVAVRRSDVQAWVKGRSEVLAPATVRLVYSFVSGVFRSAVEDRVLAASPCSRIALPKVEPKRVEPIPTATVDALLEALPARYRALVVLGAGAGLRVGEATGLTVDRVDWLRRRVRVDRQLVTPSKGPVRFGPPKTPSSVRVVPAGGYVIDALSEHVAAFPVRHPDGLLFTSSTGTALRRTGFAETFRAAARRAGVADAVSFHDLRHYYASLLIHAGQNVKVVQARLGHKSASETWDTYGHLWPDSEDDTRDAVDRILGRRQA
jgi:integrase